MKLFLFIFILISNSSFACERLYNKEDIVLMKSGKNPDVLTKCDTEKCMCLDGFPYDATPEGLEFGDIVGDSVVVKFVKHSEEQAKKQAARDAQAAEEQRVTVLKVKLDTGIISNAELVELIKIIIE